MLTALLTLAILLASPALAETNTSDEAAGTIPAALARPAADAAPDETDSWWSSDEVRRLLGARRIREIRRLRRETHFLTGRDPGTWQLDAAWRHEELCDSTEDRFLKLVREDLEERLEDRLGIEATLRSLRRRAPDDPSESDAGAPRSFRVRLSPRLRAGSSPSWGVKLSFPDAPWPWLRHASLRTRTWTDRDQSRLSFAFDDGGSTSIGIEHSFGSEIEGPASSFFVRVWW